MSATSWQFEVFFDGKCPLCRKEIAMLQRMDKNETIVFSDFTRPDFEWEQVPYDFDTLMSEIHGRFPDGRFVTGVEVFRQLYSATGWDWLVRPTRWAPFSFALGLSYRFFAWLRPKLPFRSHSPLRSCRLDDKNACGNESA